MFAEFPILHFFNEMKFLDIIFLGNTIFFNANDSGENTEPQLIELQLTKPELTEPEFTDPEFWGSALVLRLVINS